MSSSSSSSAPNDWATSVSITKRDLSNCVGKKSWGIKDSKTPVGTIALLPPFKFEVRLKSLKNTDVYIVDTFGETKKFHKISSSVFLGGSIVERGGQNPLEAARYGARILHGPNTDNFKDIYKLLKSLKVSKKIKTPNELASLIIFKKNKNIGVKIKKIGEKILKKTIKELDNLINNEFKKT